MRGAVASRLHPACIGEQFISRQMSRCLALLPLVLVVACRAELPRHDDHFARQALTDLQHGRIQAVVARTDSSMSSPKMSLAAPFRMIAAAIESYPPAD